MRGDIIAVLKTKAIVEDRNGTPREVEAILEEGTDGFGPVLRIGSTGGHWYVSTLLEGNLDARRRVLCHGATGDVLVNVSEVVIEAARIGLERS